MHKSLAELLQFYVPFRTRLLVASLPLLWQSERHLNNRRISNRFPPLLWRSVKLLQ